MRIARIPTQNGPRFAEWDDAGGWLVLDGEIGTGFTRTGAVAPADTRLLAPCEPRVVVGMAHNGLPEGRGLPTQAFLKSARTAVGPGHPITLDPRLGETQVETELAIVIARDCRNLTRENALNAVFGYTIANDVTGVEQTRVDDLLTQAKHGDGFTPIGPWIETDVADADALGTRVFVDDALVSQGSTSDLVSLIRDQLVYVTRYLTLGAGDVLLGGCPATFATVTAGQKVRLEIDGLGALENPVHAAETATMKEEAHAVHR